MHFKALILAAATGFAILAGASPRLQLNVLVAVQDGGPDGTSYKTKAVGQTDTSSSSAYLASTDRPVKVDDNSANTCCDLTTCCKDHLDDDLIPLGGSCTSFVQCLHEKAYVGQCPDGTQFDWFPGRCEYTPGPHGCDEYNCPSTGKSTTPGLKFQGKYPVSEVCRNG